MKSVTSKGMLALSPINAMNAVVSGRLIGGAVANSSNHHDGGGVGGA